MNQEPNIKTQMNFARALIILLLVALSAAGTIAQTRKANGRIAFASGADGKDGIWTMNSDGSDRRQLTTVQSRNPAWSPDGSRIAYLQGSGSEFDIWLMNADGKNQTRLNTPWSVDQSSIAWSPDGKSIAFVSLGCVFVMQVDERTPVYFGFGSSPSWSPDGSKLVVTDGQTLRILTSDGGTTQLWSDNNANDYDSAPAWSPDGTRIAFRHCVDCLSDFGSASLWTVNADGTNAGQLNILDPQKADWSPDGKKLVFASFVNGYNLFVMSLDRSAFTNLTNTGRNLAEFDPSWQPIAAPEPPVDNPIDDTQFFVHQQYADFLNREPDADGQIFWANQIMACSGDPQCVEVHRINDSAAFYLSIEFQQTGYLVYRMYKAAYANLADAPVPVKFGDFLADTRQIGQNLVVLQPGWENVLENNKQAFASNFVLRPQFTSAFPDSMLPDQFVDSLNHNAGDPLSQTERDQLVSDLISGAKSRAEVLRAVAENPTLAATEFNRAFVLMQYFGYLRRDPNAGPDTDFSGYNFWLNKLDSFHGDFVQAEMVKAFIESDEYRRRFAS